MGHADGNEGFPPNSGFNVVLRGFDRVEVQRHLADREHAIRKLASQRDAAQARADELNNRLELANSTIAELHAKLDRLCATPIEAHSLSERLDHMLRLASAEAAEIKAKAEEEASGLRRNYERKIKQLEYERQQQADEQAQVIASARKKAEAIVARAEHQRQQADTSAERRRRQADAEAKEVIRQELIASHAEAERLVSEAKAEAERLVSEATAETQRLLDETNKEIERLHSVRLQVSGQLAEALGAIQKSAPMLEPLLEERDNRSDPAGSTEPTNAMSVTSITKARFNTNPAAQR